jgi:hypothetical protein
LFRLGFSALGARASNDRQRARRGGAEHKGSAAHFASMNDIGKATRLTHTRSSERENNALHWWRTHSATSIDIEIAYSSSAFYRGQKLLCLQR